MKVLLSAYACEPHKGSDPGVGWNVALAVARVHETWVLTRANNQVPIEAELARSPVSNLHFVYFDLPRWARFWKRGQKGLHLYYYLWQLFVFRTARALQAEVGFDVVHHVTFVKYWMPSLLGAFLNVPFVWGPVGGGESTPGPFRSGLSLRGRVFELARHIGRWMGEHGPFVRATARRSAVALATTANTAARLESLGAKNVQLFSEAGLSLDDITALEAMGKDGIRPFRFISLGRLLHFKGFHLGLEAFVEAGIPRAEYWIVGGGPERERLEQLSRRLGVADRVRFWGELSREDALERLANCDVLVHPSLRESGGWVCLEAMASGRPVICLDRGGPASQVTPEVGMKVPVSSPHQAIRDLAESMRTLAASSELVDRMSAAGRVHVREHYEWTAKAEFIFETYNRVTSGGRVSERPRQSVLE